MDTQNTQVKEDLNQAESDMAKQEARNRQNIEDVRGVINSFEIRMDSKVDRLDLKIVTLEENLDMKIKQALTNPLLDN